MTEVETSRLLLRRWREDDLDAYARICADPEAMRYMGGGPLTRAETERRVEKIARSWEERGFGLWAVEHKETGAFIGRIGLQFHEDWPEGEHRVEVSWLIERSHWGKGLATEGAKASVRYGFEKLELERIISIALPQNVASRRVMEKTGLTLRGETRWRGHYVVWYAIDRRDWKG